MKIFFHSEGYHFVLLTVSFALQKLIIFRISYLFIVSLSVCGDGVIVRKLSPISRHWWLLHAFYSFRFNIVRVILRSLIHLDLGFVQGNRYESICFFLQADIQLCQYHLLKMLSVFYRIILAPLWEIRYSQLCGLITGPLIRFHWSICLLFFCQYQAVFISATLW